MGNNPKTHISDLWPDLDLTCDLLKEIFNVLESSRSGLSIAASPASLRLLVRELDGGQNMPPPPSGARSAEYPSGTRVKAPSQEYGKFVKSRNIVWMKGRRPCQNFSDERCSNWIFISISFIKETTRFPVYPSPGDKCKQVLTISFGFPVVIWSR